MLTLCQGARSWGVGTRHTQTPNSQGKRDLFPWRKQAGWGWMGLQRQIAKQEKQQRQAQKPSTCKKGVFAGVDF